MASSFATLGETELGESTLTASGGFVLVASIKKDKSKNATSHIAVMSILVLLRGSLIFGIIQNLYGYFKMQKFHTSILLFVKGSKTLLYSKS